MNNIWTYVGLGLLGWVAWDLYAGYTLVWNLVYRETSPTTYWIAVTFWFILAISCFIPWGRGEYE